MKLICKGNRGSHLPPDVLSKSRNTEVAKFNITIGHEYTAYAMKLTIYGLAVLVVGDPKRPYWYSIDLFDLIDGAIPNDWEFALVEDNEWLKALWGYRSLIRDSYRHDDLINRVQGALDAFLQDCNLQTLDEA